MSGYNTKLDEILEFLDLRFGIHWRINSESLRDKIMTLTESEHALLGIQVDKANKTVTTIS